MKPVCTFIHTHFGGVMFFCTCLVRVCLCVYVCVCVGACTHTCVFFKRIFWLKIKSLLREKNLQIKCGVFCQYIEAT